MSGTTLATHPGSTHPYGPVGATRARILATMAHELRRREGRFALDTMCIGGGQGLVAVFERAS